MTNILKNFKILLTNDISFIKNIDLEYLYVKKVITFLMFLFLLI